jgi:hypothetical protein
MEVKDEIEENLLFLGVWSVVSKVVGLKLYVEL